MQVLKVLFNDHCFDHEKLVAYQSSIQVAAWASQWIEQLRSRVAVWWPRGAKAFEVHQAIPARFACSREDSQHNHARSI
jgi:hypothetical protein